jgi:hypothetical protein
MADILKYRGPEKQDCVAFQQHKKEHGAWSDSLHGMALRRMLVGWAAYAVAYRLRFGSPIGSDGVLGDEWAMIGRGLLGLLDGETGGWDCGSISQNIRETMKANEYDPDA